MPGRSSTVTLAGHSAMNSALVYTDDASSGSWLPGKQVDGNPDGAHGFQRLADDLRRQLVVFEDVTGHHDELRAGVGRQRTESGHRVTPGGRVARLRFARQEVTGHAELPVGGVHESHCDPASLLRDAGRRRPGTASLGPPADKSGDLNRQVRHSSAAPRLIDAQASHQPHQPRRGPARKVPSIE